MHWETKKILCDSLYCSGLELDPQYLRGVPVLVWSPGERSWLEVQISQFGRVGFTDTF